MSDKFTKIVTLNEINKGAISELFEVEYQKLLNNLADENTNWKTGREITMKLKVKLSSEERSSAVSMVEVASKLAPPKANEEIIHLNFNGRDVEALAIKPTNQLNLENVVNIEEAQ